MRMPRTRTMAASLAAIALLGVAAACGDDDDDSSNGESTVEMTEAAPEAAASPEEALLANVPEVPGGTQTNQETIQEGGIHIEGTVDGDPGPTVDAYGTALEANGWTIQGSGGDPTGEAGAGVQATSSDGRYVSLNVGGDPGGTAFGDLCVWPTQPSDTQCGDDDDQDQQDDQQDQQDDQDQGDTGPPPEVEGFIPDEVEQFIP